MNMLKGTRFIGFASVGIALVALGCSSTDGTVDTSSGNGTGGHGSSSTGEGGAGGGTGGASTGEGGAGGSGGTGTGEGGAGGGTGGASTGEGGAGGTGEGGAGGGSIADCAGLQTKVDDLLAKAQSCNPTTKPLGLCSAVVDGVCCPTVVANKDSDEAKAYLDALKEYKAECPVMCPATLCPEVKGGTCETSSSSDPAAGHCVATGGATEL